MMELVERNFFLEDLHSKFNSVETGEGHSVFISGEAGIGKTSLVTALAEELQDRCYVYKGTCDALFTPRPLAPLFDIYLQICNSIPETGDSIAGRSRFFTDLFFEIKNQNKPALVIFEDIHWADEATLDFIKF